MTCCSMWKRGRLRRWNISGVSLRDEVIRKIYYANALRHLPALKASITRQLNQ
jgi:hypothetical protein